MRKNLKVYVFLLVVSLSLDCYSNEFSREFCSSVPMIAVVANPSSYNEKKISIKGVLEYKVGVSQRIFIDKFSLENGIFENSFSLDMYPGYKNLELADGSVVEVCGVLAVPKDSKNYDGLYPTRVILKDIKYIYNQVYTWKNGAWDIN